MWDIILKIKVMINKALWRSPILRNDEEFEKKRRLDDPLYLERFGYKVFSQNDEDGIISEIFNRIGTTNKKFVEFGVGNGLECNSHFLLHKGWKGLWIEGNKKCIKQIKKLFVEPLKKSQLTILNEFITRENINELIGGEGGVKGEIDLLSIDIDGNDFWVWEGINCIDSRVVVIEYNPKFPPPHEWVMPYDPKYIYDGTSDFLGASLESLDKLGRKLGYQLVGTTMGGINAFFVKSELAQSLFVLPATAVNLYNPQRLVYYLNSGYKSIKYRG
jgi:hypothetical protein